MSEDKFINNDSLNSEEEEETGSKRVSYEKSILREKLPADPSVLFSALQLASDRNIRITKLADTVLLDPIITLEVLSKANTTYSSIDKAGITAIQTAVIRIGSENLAELFLEIKARKEIADPDVQLEFESLRKLASKAGVVAEIMSNHLQRDISETAQTATSLAYIGQMLCCKVLGRSYLEFSSLKRKSALAYKLQSNFKIDLQKIHMQYLKDKGLPGFIFYAYDKELKCKTSAQSSLRFITDSAIELVEAIEDGKWDKYRSTNTFPGKSNLRLLKFHEGVYDLIKEEIEDAMGFNVQALGISDSSSVESITDDTFIASRGNLTIDTIPEKTIEEKFPILEDRPSESDPEESVSKSMSTNTIVIPRSILPKDTSPELASRTIDSEIAFPSNPAEYSRTELSVDSQAIYGLIQYLCQEANSVSTLLKDLMSILTEQGPFTRAAIIEIGPTSNSPQIHSAIGEDFEDLIGQQDLQISDPLSPITLLATRVRSYNSVVKSDPLTPFGITSYAISPITLNSSSPLILYADCGISRPVPLEARKVFRIVVQLLSETLPSVSERSQLKRTH